MALNIEPFVYRYFDDVNVYGNPVTDLKVCCPFCQDDTKYHLHISLNKQAAHCFRCGYKANWVKLVTDITGFPYHKVLGELYETPKLSKLTKTADKPTVKLSQLPEGFVNLCSTTTIPWAEASRKYMLKRGFSKDYWLDYNIGVSNLLYRVIIPIEAGYWQGRSIVSWQEPKYINPKIDNRRLIFNSDALAKYDEVVVCEGAFSAMAVGKNAIALISKEPTDERCERLIASKVKKFIIALEPGAYGSMGKLLQRLVRCGKEVTVWKYSEGDPADPKGKFEVYDWDISNRVKMELSL